MREEKFYGYGIEISELEFHRLEEFVRKYTPEILKELIGDIESDDYVQDPDKAILRWMKDYEYGGSFGFAAYLASVINEQEGTNLKGYDLYGNFLYVPYVMPWHVPQKMRFMRKADVDSILKKYLFAITEDKLSFDIVEMQM